MKPLRLAIVPLLLVGALLGNSISVLAAVTYRQLTVIHVPGKSLNSFDISWVDPTTQTYYLADRSNKAVDAFSAVDNTFVTRYKGFVGVRQLCDPTCHNANEVSGPDGVVIVHPEHELWATDGDSTVKVFDLKSGEKVATISTGGAFRADELAYDQKDHMILVANADEDVPFVSFISVPERKVVGKIEMPQATNGLEQPVWDKETHRFYLSVPQVGSNKLNGGIAVFNPDTLTLEKTFPVHNCQPAGLALGFKQHLALGCSGDAIAAGAQAQTQIMDARTGQIVMIITKVGGSDQVWYNPGDKRYYLAARDMPDGPVLGVIDAVTNTWLANIKTGPNSHSVAADPINNHVFVPLRGVGIGVYAAN
jgi:DNA-binding beta-propeller fold protein YncE